MFYLHLWHIMKIALVRIYIDPIYRSNHSSSKSPGINLRIVSVTGVHCKLLNDYSVYRFSLGKSGSNINAEL